MKAAVPQLKNILKNNKYIFFGIKGGGCNGFKYILEPINKFDEKNVTFNDDLSNLEVPIVVCNKSLMYIIGTEIDWKEDYMGSRFVFNNPVASGTCGCGTTFNV